ncbi:MAG: sugar ABC transporter ATP-binding protein [Oscillospiraceae bacterium]|nr:sugar ABC transporter ATP-binding protein [Oscillospiraceae bacterium]
MGQEIKLRVSNIEKSFPGVKALQNVDFIVKKGTVHVLCGENGAGKSTLMKIINGIYQPDKGQIYIDEKPVKISNPIQARNLGISMIFQEMNFVSEMSVEENIFLGRLPVNKFGKVDWKYVREHTLQLLKDENLPYPPDLQLKMLTISDIQMLEIIKAISYKSDIIIMDEPTSAITQKEVEKLFEKIEALKAQGACVIYISHKLDEIFRIADDITVFRDGMVVSTGPASETDINTVIAQMVGRKLSGDFPKEEAEIGEKLLEVDDFTQPGVFSDISFDLRRGEIIGFAGLMGAGRTEVMRAIFGLDSFERGKVKCRGQRITIKNVRESINNGLVMLSEDRRRYGIIPVRSVKENATLSSLKKIIRGGFLNAKREAELVGELFSKMRVKTPTIETAIQALSGGNQQKVILSKWMMCEPDILILDEPTRGIDVGAKYEIYKLMSEMAKGGKGIIMVSSELPELIGMCDRIYVMHKGRISGEIARKDFSQERIMYYATGTENNAIS